MNSQKQRSFAKIISIFILIFLIVGGIGFLAHYTNDFTDDFKTFYVQINGKRIITNDYDLDFETNKDVRFDCKYTFNLIPNKEPKGYKVKIVPNITDDTDFDFKLNGEYNSYLGIDDLTSAFNLEITNGYFVLNIPEDITMLSILSKVYKDENVVIDDNIILHQPYFSIIVTSYNDAVSYKINIDLNQPVPPVTGVALDKESLELWEK